MRQRRPWNASALALRIRLDSDGCLVRPEPEMRTVMLCLPLPDRWADRRTRLGLPGPPAWPVPVWDFRLFEDTFRYAWSRVWPDIRRRVRRGGRPDADAGPRTAGRGAGIGRAMTCDSDTTCGVLLPGGNSRRIARHTAIRRVLHSVRHESVGWSRLAGPVAATSTRKLSVVPLASVGLRNRVRTTMIVARPRGLWHRRMNAR